MLTFCLLYRPIQCYVFWLLLAFNFVVVFFTSALLIILLFAKHCRPNFCFFFMWPNTEKNILTFNEQKHSKLRRQFPTDVEFSWDYFWCRNLCRSFDSFQTVMLLIIRVVWPSSLAYGNNLIRFEDTHIPNSCCSNPLDVVKIRWQDIPINYSSILLTLTLYINFILRW